MLLHDTAAHLMEGVRDERDSGNNTFVSAHKETKSLQSATQMLWENVDSLMVKSLT